MKALICSLIAVASILAFSDSLSAEEDNGVALSSCIDAGFSDLMSERSSDFESPQFYIVCQYRDVDKREKNETFTYFPPAGFKIISADVNVVSITAQASVHDLAFEEQRATVNLRCKGRPEADHVHDAVAVKLVGKLEYRPTLDDTKNIGKACLRQFSER